MVTTDSSGNVSFSNTSPMLPGQFFTATATDPNNNTSEFSQCASVGADLIIAKTDAPDPVQAGQNLTYTITVGNNGPLPATGVTVTDTVPSGVTFVSASANQGSCTGTSTVTCALGNLGTGASAIVTITVRPSTAGTLTNTASVQGSESDPDTANNTDT